MMPIPDVAYWQERFRQVEQSEHRQAEQVYSDIEDMYKRADREIEQKISSWYQRFADNNGITMAEARHLLSTRELAEFKWTVDDYIKHGKENGISADWSKQLENASARFHITRLQALQLDLQQTVEVLYGGQSDAFDRLMKQVYQDSYYRTAFEIQRGVGIGWDIAKVNGNQLEKVLHKPWTLDGRNFSDRIWANKSALIGELQKTLQQNVILGKPPDYLIQQFSQKLGVSESNAARLLYTESAYFSQLSQGDSFRALGVDNVIFIATLDERTSQICQDMDGTVIPMKDYQPGTTVPPLHPWCRSTTAPYYKDLEGIGERAARDPDTGTTYWVPRSTKYPDWKASFVDGGSKDGLTPINPLVKMTLDQCSTVAEVEALMKQQGWFNVETLGGKVYDTNKSLSLAGCDLECAKGAYTACEQIFNRYPQLIGKLNSISVADLSRGTYAQCMVGFGHGGVTLNKRFFSDSAKLAQSIARDLQAGFHPANTDWIGIITHEFGHAIDDFLTNIEYLAGSTPRGRTKWVSAEMRPRVMRDAGFKVSDTRREVSGYATKDHYEWFAECFCEFMRSPTPRTVATTFGKALDEMMKGVK